jgi:hypothetical protein
MSGKLTLSELKTYSRVCYQTNNNYAYCYDVYCVQSEGSQEAQFWLDMCISEAKHTNFVPSYDKWCLGCGEHGVIQRCSGCRSVFFCNQECMKRAWPIHKKHCKRNLFDVCATCGEKSKVNKCDNCPVKWCSERCKDKIYADHVQGDCQYFAKTFES